MLVRKFYVVVSVWIVVILSSHFGTSSVSTETYMEERFKYLISQASKSVLVHVHVPKAGGTALSNALSTECQCTVDRQVVDGVSQPNCKKCKTVSGDRIRTQYTLSRSTGWKLGVHPSYAAMRYVLTHSPNSFAKYGVIPVYIVMLRNPFERFISESLHWVKNTGQAIDWSIVNERNGKRYYLSGVNGTEFETARTHTDHSNTTTHSLPAYVMTYASLPSYLILHDRHAKMIGGSEYDYNAHFDPKHDLGSRWKPRKGLTSSKLLNYARTALESHRDLLFGLHERFAEFMCVLEVVYGHLYRFAWDPAVHSHNTRKPYTGSSSSSNNNSSVSSSNTGTSVSTDASVVYSDVYRVWARSNQADEKLYTEAQRIFEVEFQSALGILRKRKETTGNSVLKTTPHCVPFL